jgi:Spy/CpxP family protein refolding chaperone
MPGGGSMPAGSNVPGGSPAAGIGVAGNTRQGLPPNSSSQEGATGNTMRGGLQLGPPGRWWDDKHFAKTLHLRPEQKKRMDDLFDESRTTLVSRYQALQQEESKMEALSHAQTLEESILFAQIDRVAQARADLEKANTHLLLQVRKEMDADQITHLDASR